MSDQNPNEHPTLKDEVEALRRRLDEQGALIRRTHTGVTTLAESLGKVVAGQRSRERWLNLNSFVAYTLFTVLLGGGFFMLYSKRAGELVAARDSAMREVAEARARAGELQGILDAGVRAEQAALEYYSLLRDDKRVEAIARFPEIEQQPLTPTERALFTEGVKNARAEIVDAGYLSGLDAYRAGELGQAAAELRTALAYEDEGPRAAQMRYYLGLTYFKKADYENAARQLELARAGRVDQAGVVDARYYLASALEKSGQLEQARAEYDKFATAHPSHPWAAIARRRSAQLAYKGIRTN